MRIHNIQTHINRDCLVLGLYLSPGAKAFDFTTGGSFSATVEVSLIPIDISLPEAFWRLIPINSALAITDSAAPAKKSIFLLVRL